MDEEGAAFQHKKDIHTSVIYASLRQILRSLAKLYLTKLFNWKWVMNSNGNEQ